MRPKDADGMANSVDPDQTDQFAQICLSENLGTLRYFIDFAVPLFSLVYVYVRHSCSNPPCLRETCK